MTHHHNGVITHLEPDILECKVKWALGSITTNKASGGDGTPVELFQILKDDCGSDHELIIAKLRLKVKKVGKSTRPWESVLPMSKMRHRETKHPAYSHPELQWKTQVAPRHGWTAPPTQWT